MSAPKFTQLEGYEVLESGKVISTRNWRGMQRRTLAPVLHRGYLAVRLSAPDGKRLRVMVHQLVAHTYRGPRPSPAHQVRHLDGNPLNNHATNLAWGTASENALDRSAHGRAYRPDWNDPAIREKYTKNKRGAKARAALAKARGESNG